MATRKAFDELSRIENFGQRYLTHLAEQFNKHNDLLNLVAQDPIRYLTLLFAQECYYVGNMFRYDRVKNIRNSKPIKKRMLWLYRYVTYLLTNMTAQERKHIKSGEEYEKHSSYQFTTSQPLIGLKHIPNGLYITYGVGSLVSCVYIANGEPVGSIEIRTEDDHEIRIYSVLILEHRRGLGYGKSMVLATLDIIQRCYMPKPIRLYVDKNNLVALKTYQTVGFEIIGETETTDSTVAGNYDMEFRK